MRLIDMRPPRIALFLTLIAAFFHWTFDIWNVLRFAWPWGGIIMGVAGLSLIMWSWGLFKKGNVAICPKAKTTSIITNGPYGFSRNPMYLGMELMLIGIALGVGTLPFYLSAIVFFMIINNEFCPYEENKLLNTFGSEYLQYSNRVRRWI